MNIERLTPLVTPDVAAAGSSIGHEILVGAIASIVAALLVMLCQWGREWRRLSRASACFRGRWMMCEVFNGELFRDRMDCEIEVKQPRWYQPAILRVDAKNAQPEAWGGDALINPFLSNRASLVWVFTEPTKTNQRGEYELLLQFREAWGRIYSDPTMATKVAGQNPQVWMRPDDPEFQRLTKRV